MGANGIYGQKDLIRTIRNHKACRKIEIQVNSIENHQATIRVVQFTKKTNIKIAY